MCTPGFHHFRSYTGGVELWGKPYVIKPRCYWEHIGERTWEQRKKNPCLPPSERKKLIVCEYMLSLSIGFMKFLFPKLLVTIFHIG